MLGKYASRVVNVTACVYSVRINMKLSAPLINGAKKPSKVKRTHHTVYSKNT
jgi:hypothetical protein